MKRRQVVFAAPRATKVFLNDTNSIDMSGSIRSRPDVLWMAAEWSLHSRKTWVGTAMQNTPKWWRALFLSTVHLNGVSTVKERAVAFREQTTSIGTLKRYMLGMGSLDLFASISHSALWKETMLTRLITCRVSSRIYHRLKHSGRFKLNAFFSFHSYFHSAWRSKISLG